MPAAINKAGIIELSTDILPCWWLTPIRLSPDWKVAAWVISIIEQRHARFGSGSTGASRDHIVPELPKVVIVDTCGGLTTRDNL